MEIAFGPVPSRRLGHSLGINNIPPKHCSYSCIYCQVGPTPAQEISPRVFYPPQEIRRQVEAHLHAVRARGEAVASQCSICEADDVCGTQVVHTMKRQT